MSVHLLLHALCWLTLADDTLQLEDIKLELPKRISGIDFRERKDFDEKELGYGVSYGNRACNINIYVYDHGLKKIPDGKLGATIDDELKAALADVATAKERGIFTNFERLKGELSLPMPALDKFMVAGFKFDLQGLPCKSYLLITGRADKFIKIRFTQYIVDGKTNDAELAEFLETVAKQLE